RVSVQDTFMAAQIIPFISRAQLLQRRGPRNFSRWKMTCYDLVEADGPERRKWQQEAAAEALADLQWAKHHGKVEGGAWVARFPSPEIPALPDTQRVRGGSQ
ncbi:MAG TPA: hypothetical protein VNJ04_21095, partial [Gemmatimonadaceae bacterium]|nr:hypothetical protein [Gemmatimonadaceae bacterium]